MIKMAKLDEIFNNFCKIVDKPEDFLSPEEHHTDLIKKLLKTTYDFTKDEEKKPNKSSALPELITEGFDIEQIWQQQELQNESFLNKILIDVSRFVVNKNSLVFDEFKNKLNEEEENQNNQENQELEGNLSEDVSDDEENVSDDEKNFSDDEEDNEEGNENLNEDDDELSEENLNENIPYNKKKSKKSIVDDDFFKLDEMEEFLKAEDKKFERENDADSGNDTELDENDEDDENDDEKINENEIDYFKELDDEEVEDERLLNPRFKDFFRRNDDQRGFDRKSRRFNEENDESEDNNYESEGKNYHSEEKNESWDENNDESDENNDNLDENNDFDENDKDFNEKNKDLKSTFELREERLKNKIEKIEETALSKKPWPMLGEITAENRPINSLLEEVVEFDVGTRPAPVITEKTSLQLDDIIKQRIKDKAFDSVERKEKLVETPLEYKKKIALDQEKSKESLAQIYEKEFLQQQEALNQNKDEDKEEEEPELHKEIKTMMDSLFRKLDALSNYHFTPKPAIPELKIVNNLPAINMEEVAPVATSDAKLLAPEEVKNRIKGDIIGKSERSETDKNRERRKKKRKQRIHALRKEKREALINKINPGLGNKYSKEKAKKQLEKVIKDKNVDKMDESYGSKAVKSSTAFFNQLQDEVKSQIKQKVQAKKRKSTTSGLTAKKIKL